MDIPRHKERLLEKERSTMRLEKLLTDGNFHSYFVYYWKLGHLGRLAFSKVVQNYLDSDYTEFSYYMSDRGRKEFDNILDELENRK